MAVLPRTSVVLVIVCSTMAGVWCYPNGAPTNACVTMLPGHRQDDGMVVLGQTVSNPYTITADSTDFVVNQTITVTITAGVEFKGILMQARLVGTETPVGRFHNIPAGAKAMMCTSSSDSVTHSSTTAKMSGFSVQWTAPNTGINFGNVKFVATIAYTKEIFWRHVNSSVITAVHDLCDPNPCLNGGTCYKAADGRSYFCGCPGSAAGTNCEDEIIPCSDNSCLNGGTCSNTPTGHSCTCDSGWFGDDCSLSLNYVCSDNSCLNNGTCFDSNPPGRLIYHCACDAIFTGRRCETADPCRVGPCANGGTCSQVGDTVQFTCACIDGFEGDRCETTTNPCQSSPCLNGGLCFQDEFGNTHCQCPPTHTGTFCETQVHPCDRLPSPCLNGGSCFRSHGDDYVCICPDGYSGGNCETLVDPCASNPCQNGGTCQPGAVDEDYICTCPAEYFGDNCQSRGVCHSVQCENGGTCVAHADQTGYICQCQRGYEGTTCEFADMCQLDNPCEEGSSCNYLGQGHIQCNCPPGLQGQYCQVDTSCAGTPCLNGGTCMPLGGGISKCHCGAAYSGDTCEIYTNPCTTDPCVHGQCMIVLDLPTGRNCSCDRDYMGENCTIYIGNACEVFECLNGGECINSQPEPTCVCSGNYSGIHCETPLNPTITNCPSGVNPSFPLNEGSNMANIELTITASDWQNKALPLTVTDGLQFPSTVTFTEEYREGKEITIEAQDDEGRTATCEFKLRIYDDEDPTVVCPTDVSAITTEDSVAVTFPMGTASDNLGINGALQYTPTNGSKFTPGMNTVIVKALDTFDNQGECSFKVIVHKKEFDCNTFTAPDNGISSCVVVGDQRMCAISCNEGFGNAVGTNDYMCKYNEASAYWDPRPNADICVPFKPGNGVSKVVSIRFPIDSDLCNNADFDNSVVSSLTDSLQAMGICDPNSSVMSCDFSVACEDAGGNRRRRATTNLNVDMTVTSTTADGDTNMDVLTRLGDAVDGVMTAAINGSLSIRVDEATILNDPTAFQVSDNTWNCKPGQITRLIGCLSCPPGSFHNSDSNTCEYCPVNTYQNKPEQDSCISCPMDTGLEQTGAYSAEHCGPVSKPNTGPWTPTLIGLVAGAGALIILLLVVLACVYIVKVSRRPSGRSSSKSKEDVDGPLSNFTHLNKAYEECDEPEMQFHGGQSLSSETTYQNVVDDDVLDTGSTDHLVRIPSLSQYSDYYATLNAKSAPDPVPDSPPPPPPVSAPTPPQANGGPPSPPPAPPAPPTPPLNTNNSNKSADHTYQSGSVVSSGGGANFLV